LIPVLNRAGKYRWSHAWAVAVRMTSALILYFITVLILTITFLVQFGDAHHWIASEVLADCLGLFSMICSTIQFMPQLVKTWRSKVNNE
jgi:uncharacterized protein with PQ loop repeat